LRQSTARQVWAALSETEQAMAIKAAKGYVIHRARQKKPPNVLNAHTFLKERDGWAPFAALVEDAKPAGQGAEFVAEGSPAWLARQVIGLIKGEKPMVAMAYDEGKGLRLPPLSAAQLALEHFAGEDPSSWPIVKTGTQMCGAWRQFLGIEPRQITVGTMRKEIYPGKFVDDWPIKELGLRVPCDWPPRKDGSLYQAEDDEERTATQEDEHDDASDGDERDGLAELG